MDFLLFFGAQWIAFSLHSLLQEVVTVPGRYWQEMVTALEPQLAFEVQPAFAEATEII